MENFQIFVNTGPYLAHFHLKDQRHQQAIEGWQWIEKQDLILVTTNHVLDELATLLASRTDYRFAAMKIREIHESSLQIERTAQNDEAQALDFFEKYADQKISFTDCISFVVMRRLGLKKCFPFDRHFLDAGFEVSPQNY